MENYFGINNCGWARKEAEVGKEVELDAFLVMDQPACRQLEHGMAFSSCPKLEKQRVARFYTPMLISHWMPLAHEKTGDLGQGRLLYLRHSSE